MNCECSAHKFDRILEHLHKLVGRGQEVVDYIPKIDKTLYARHAFPLPQLGIIYSNLIE